MLPARSLIWQIPRAKRPKTELWCYTILRTTVSTQIKKRERAIALLLGVQISPTEVTVLSRPHRAQASNVSGSSLSVRTPRPTACVPPSPSFFLGSAYRLHRHVPSYLSTRAYVRISVSIPVYMFVQI